MEARVALGVGLLVGFSLGAVVIVTTRTVTSRSLDRASVDLEVARSAFYRSLETRAESAAALARLVTELPVFRAHMTDARLAGDPGTIREMADEYRLRLRAQFCIVTNGRGTWLGSPGWPAGQGASPALQSTIETATGGRSNREIVPIQDRLFLVVSEPARFAEEILGTMTVGYALDDTVAEDLAQATHCQVSLVWGTHLSGSSLRDGERAAFVRRLAANGPEHLGQAAGIRRLGAGPYIEGTFPLVPDHASERLDRLVLLQDWRPTQRFLDELERQFLWAGAIIFAIALAGGLAFSRRMSRPLMNIAAAAKDIADGNWARQVPVGGSAEAITMAVAFNGMSTSFRAAQGRLLHDALHDHLTQLPNRALFMERLQHASRRRTRRPHYTFAVLFVDLDRFKTVNDSLGHPAGDQLLLEIARRMTQALRRDDTVSRPAGAAGTDGDADVDNTLARLGGDEFTILLDDIRDPSDAVRIAERIQEAVAAPISLEGQEVFTSASVGIAVSTALHRAGEELVRDADLAMYRAKASGGARCVVFDVTMHERAVERLKLESDLRHALDRGELVLHYQPIVSLHDHRILGCEALLRWQHPEHGLLSPAAFLTVAEEAGLVTRIDHWVLRAACADACRWQAWFPGELPAVYVSVNISAESFGQPDIVRRVATALEETGLDARQLRLEITETIAMADAERARLLLTELKALGVRISLDDFGTGYSSLSYLQRLPVDTLKIDRSFVAGMEGEECREIIRTILNLARTLRLDVIAEGMETAAQVEYLERFDCRFGQGYFFSRALPIGQLRAILRPGAERPDRQLVLEGGSKPDGGAARRR
jgi:predicted signal transduction protein with EAL and GGDEF domain